MSLLQECHKDFILLIEAGFIAVNQFDEDAAIKLFRAAALLNPTNPLSQLGLGYIHLCKLELKAASAIFSAILEKDPQQEMAQTLLGLTQSLNPTEVAKGEKRLEETAKSAQDPMIKNLAKSALEFVEKFVKKPLSPVQAPTKKKQ